MTALSRLILSSIFLLLGGPVGAGELIEITCEPSCDAQPSENELQLVEQRYDVHGLRDPFNTPKKLMTDHMVPASWAALTAAALLANQRERATDCLAKMEQAMRVMEPWVSISGYGSMQAYERGRVDGITAESPGEMKRLVERFVTATNPIIAQWNDAKRDCWITP